MAIHGSLWRQALWQDLWELGHQKQITVYHLTGHAPLASPENDEADMLAKVRWLETVPAIPSGRSSLVAAPSPLTCWAEHHVIYNKNLGVAYHLSRGMGSL